MSIIGCRPDALDSAAIPQPDARIPENSALQMPAREAPSTFLAPFQSHSALAAGSHSLIRLLCISSSNTHCAPKSHESDQFTLLQRNRIVPTLCMDDPGQILSKNALAAYIPHQYLGTIRLQLLTCIKSGCHQLYNNYVLTVRYERKLCLSTQFA